ncbi:ESX-1 secretion-associated protein EspI-like [Myotis myotis]|uniref:ESX-1 secretion-associated protein EspI-like n=1 Tax=Myotis myotis TaxID=51298 RepID=UPI0017480BE2|nr:ESX-1 secretion-associated protein EspI-like [Myotis myotis]
MEHRLVGRFPRTPPARPGSRLAAVAAVGPTRGRRNTNSHPTSTATLGGPQGVRWRRSQRVPGSATPTSGTRTRPPQSPGTQPPEVHSWRRLPGRYLAGLSRSPPGAGRGLRAPHVWLQDEPGEGALQRLRGELGAATSSHSGFSPVEPQASSGSPPAFPERRHPSPQFPPRDTRSRAANTFQGKLRTPPGAALPSVRRPRGAHAPPKRRSGEIPEPEPNPQDENVRARHGTAASGPHARRWPHALLVPGSCAATPGGERGRRAAPDGEGAVPPGTHRQLGRRGGEARDGKGKTQYGRAPQLLPAVSSSRLREDAATSRQQQLRCRPRQYHIPPSRWLPPSPPALPPAAMATWRQGD